MIDIGSVLADRYELLERLGVGGMGEVYRALDHELEREVAIKSLLPHLARNDDLLQRFRREARTLARVRHSGIIALFDMLRLPDGALYLVLELVPGNSLEDELADGPLAWTRCVDIGTQVCGALAAAHAREVIHRDIKPSNILLEPSGLVRVADFGIARLAGASKVTRAGMAMGTPGFWAPEQALGEASSPQTDLYAVGAVLFQAATGRMPFVAAEEGPASMLLNVTRPVPDPREALPGLAPAAAEVIMHAMAKDPAERWSSAVEMAAALRATVDAPTVTPMEGVPLPGTFAPAVTAPPPPATIVTPPPLATPPPATAPPATPAPVAAPAPATPPTAAGPTRAPTPAPVGATRTPEPATRPAGAEPGATDAPPPTAPTRHAPTARTERAPVAPARGRGRLVGAAVVLAVLAAGGGLLASGGLSGDDGTAGSEEPVPPVRVRAGTGSLAIPGAWRSSAGGSLPGLTLADAATARPDASDTDAGTGGRLVAGVSRGEGRTLLPASFVARLDAPPAQDDPVALGEIAAYRYADLGVEGLASPVTLFVVPTTDGVETIACVGGEPAFQAECAGAATTLRMSGTVRARAIGPDAAYASLLSQTLTTLDAARVRLRDRLDDAATPTGQAAAATSLATAHTTAAGALGDVDLGPEGAGLNEAVVAALRAQAAGYRRMAAAAGSDSRRGFAAGRGDVTRGESSLARALATLDDRGYQVAG